MLITNSVTGFGLLILLFVPLSYASPTESWYQSVWCNGMGGQVEFRMEDGQRIDCLTDQYAIEVEFARKWHEAIGQSLNYSMLTGKQAGIVLVIKTADDVTHWRRLQSIVEYYSLPIRLWRLNS